MPFWSGSKKHDVETDKKMSETDIRKFYEFKEVLGTLDARLKVLLQGKEATTQGVKKKLSILPRPPFYRCKLEEERILRKMADKAIRNKVIVQAFTDGFSTNQIKSLLASKCDVTLSDRQIRRIVSAAGLLGSESKSTPADVVSAIRHEQNGPGEGLGYRMMWHRLKSVHHLNVSRNTVQHVMKLLDPDGAALRQERKLRRRIYTNPGPNHTIHIDGYDKLKPFGLCIHGAIDGYSRKVLWLRVGPSNNNPNVVAAFFLDFVKGSNGIPLVVRADGGTENIRIQDIQTSLRMHHAPEGPAGVIIGRSVSNQRIERYWRDLRAHLQMIINLLKDLSERGHFTRNSSEDKELVRYCFTQTVQHELDVARRTWNSHAIRRSPTAECPAGVPNVLYSLSEHYGGADFLVPVPENELDPLEDYVERPEPVTTESKLLFDSLLNGHNPPESILDSARLYAFIKDALAVQ